MADVLAGQGCSWTFEAGAMRVRFERGLKVPKLLQELGERLIPFDALSGVSLSPGKRGTVVLRAVPRMGADPVLVAAGGQLKESLDPYRLVLPVEREALADYYADEIRRSVGDRGPAAHCLIDGPPVPRNFKGWDGQASFDGKTVRLQWFWSSAESHKYQAGDQAFPVADIEEVEWRSPDVFDGYLRFKVRGFDSPKDPARDPASVVFGMGYGLTAESLPLAAAVVAAVRQPAGDGAAPVISLVPEPAPAVPELAAAAPEADTPKPDGAELPEEATGEPAAADPGRAGDPGQIAELIRKLGDLRDAGLLTDEEFQAKKAELLARL